MQRNIVQFLGNEFLIHADNKKFIEFTRKYLRRFSDCLIRKESGNIRVTYHWNNDFDKTFDNKIGKKACIRNNKICYEGNHYHIIAKMGQIFDINIYPQYTSFKNMMKELIKNAFIETEYHFYQTLLRNGFHFPLFYILEKEKFRLYHGSACKMGKNIFIMPGAAGIGKTIANLCFQIINPDAISITDNYLLFKNDKIYTFPEPLRLPTLYNNSILADFDFLFNIKNRGYYFNKNMISQSFSLKDHKVYFIFLIRGKRQSLQKIDYPKSMKIVQTTTNYVSHEFHRGSWVSFLPYIDNKPNDKYSDDGKLIINSSVSYICEVPMFNTFDDAISTYRSIIENVLH